jgi:thiamine-phosphate pyrophosphorylase
MRELPRFYPIVDSADWVARAVALGVRLIQLRIKDRSLNYIRQHIRRARASAGGGTGTMLVINDYWQLAIEEECDFVHLGQEDLDSADLTAIRHHGLRLGVSTHDHAELARGLSVDPDYVALGPIYPTKLKSMSWAPQGLERIAEWKRRVAPRPLVAIGGLTVERAGAVLSAGADVAAVVTDVTLNADPDHRIQEWLSITSSWAGLKGRPPASR